MQNEIMTKSYNSTFSLNSTVESEDRWTFTGVASTRNKDRIGDIVEPTGVSFELPVPLLFEHEEVVGAVTNIVVKQQEIFVEFYIEKPKENAPTTLKDRFEEVQYLVVNKLANKLSIGYKIKEANRLQNGALHIKKWEFVELSIVVNPANNETYIKKVEIETASCQEDLNLTNNTASGIKILTKSNLKEKGNFMLQDQLKNIKETIEKKKAERLKIQNSAIMRKESKTSEEREIFDTLSDEIAQLEIEEKDIGRLIEEDLATVVDVKQDEVLTKSYNRAPSIIEAPEKLEKGIAFARYAMSLGSANGELVSGFEIAKKRFPKDKRLHSIFKKAVDAGSTQSANWSDLVDYDEMTTDFIEYLRPKTLIGQFGTNGIPALRQAPFNVKIGEQTGGGSAGWVGEGQHKPVTSQDFSKVNLDRYKLSCITVLTDELLRDASPSAQALVRDDLANAIAYKMNSDFIDLANNGIDDVKPASITYSAGTVNTDASNVIYGSGMAEKDISDLWDRAIASNYDLSSAVYITSPTVAKKLSMLRTTLGEKIFPDIDIQGGFIDKTRVIVSNYVDANMFYLAFASEIWLAEGGIDLSASKEASILMSETPELDYQAGFGSLSTDATAADIVAVVKNLQKAQYVNLWQTNQVGFRAEKYVNWAKRRFNAIVGVPAVLGTKSGSQVIGEKPAATGDYDWSTGAYS